ncbi:MAG: ATP-binding cassette domain-containing protein [Microcella pacifica]
MSGIEAPTAGELHLDGKRVQFARPVDAQHAGIYTIHQELSLAPYLSVAENIYISDLPRNNLGIINWRAVHRNAEVEIRNLGFDIPVDIPVGMLSMAEQQVVEIAKAVHRKAKVILLDEPTATLPQPDVDRLFEVVGKLRAEGVAVVFISHRLDEVYRLCERISVMRDGRRIQTKLALELTPEAAVRSMVGEGLVDDMVGQITRGVRRRINPRGAAPGASSILDVRGLSDANLLRDVSFTVKSGEAVAVTGLVGSGQSELATTLFGGGTRTEGEIYVNAHRLRTQAPREAIRAGLGMIPEERKSQGLVLDMTVKANISMASLGSINRFGVRRSGKENAPRRPYDPQTRHQGLGL